MPDEPNTAHEEIVRYYDETGRHYRFSWSDRHIHYGYWDDEARGHPRALERMVEVVEAQAPITSDLRVLDAGCGFGGSAVWIAAQRGAEVCGITLVPGQVEEARKAAGLAGVSERTTFETRDFCATGYADGSFDRAWFLESLSHVSRVADAIREAFRVLRPGGWLIGSDGFRTAPPAEGEDPVRDLARCWAMADIATIDDVRAALQGAGFADIELRDVTAHIMPSVRKLRRMARMWYLPAVVMRAARITTSAEWRNLVGARRQHRVFSEGLVKYMLIRARKPR